MILPMNFKASTVGYPSAWSSAAFRMMGSANKEILTITRSVTKSISNFRILPPPVRYVMF